MSYLLQHWSFDPFLILAVVVVIWHEIGLARLARWARPERTRQRRRRAVVFYSGLAVLLIAYTGCVWFSVAYLGEHYIVDALAALVYVAVATVAVTVVARIRQSALSQVPTATLK